MSIADSVPGMRAGSTVRNIIVAIVYLFLLPFMLALLPITIGVIVGKNVGGSADKLAKLPGIGTGGGVVAGAAAGIYAVVLFVALGAVLPSDDTASAPEQNIDGAEATAADGGSQAAASTPTETSGSSGAGDSTPTPTSEPTATPTATPKPTPTATATPKQSLTHSVGESFTVGSGAKTIKYTVTDVSTTSNVGGEYGEDADGQFVIVTLKMENTGDESLDLSSRPFTLVDSQGREFEVDQNAMVYTEDSIVFEQLNPGLSKQGKVVFDVAADGSYDLHIAPAGMFSTGETHTVELEGEIQ